MNKFSNDWPAANFIALERDGNKALFMTFYDEQIARSWDRLMETEPHSLTINNYTEGHSKVIFRFTNHTHDYIFQWPHQLHLKPPYHLMICVQDEQSKKIQPFGSYLINPDPLN